MASVPSLAALVQQRLADALSAALPEAGAADPLLRRSDRADFQANGMLALAKRLKREIGEEYGEPYARLAELLNEARGWAKATLPTYQDRKVFFESIVNGDPDPVELLRRGDEQAVRDLIAAAQERAAVPA
jgi:hypothetical protein